MTRKSANEAKPRILIVDDDKEFASALGLLLGKHFHIESAHDGKEALARVDRQGFDAYLLDYDLKSDMDGLEVLQSIRSVDPYVPAIIVTRHDQPETILNAGRLGATDFFSKGSSIELLSHRLKAALEKATAERRNEALQRMADKNCGDFVGQSEVIHQIRADVETVAPTNSTVFITGDSGTGKGVLARLIHTKSKRSGGPFIEINCAAVPEGLVESELFGHEKGSFTGATAARRGCFELAQDGTLFLDEITEMPIHLQPKLLRVLQSGEFNRLGSERVVATNSRIICATNRNADAAVQDGSLREDLFFRINVIRLTIPPLREHPEDIIILARHFIRLKAMEQGKRIPALSKAAESILTGYSWPGNIRELENVMERAIVFCRSGEIGPGLLGSIGEGAGYVTMGWEEARELALNRFERSYLTLVLRLHNGSVSKASKSMGVSRQAIYKAFERTGIDPESFR
ncbi:MAG: sigma-54 dependent transcriptional regulator [Candidatus Eisenbacteria bacterium]|uniref:Sigma-54 dependent transcriptional regulator n=1 Tax=Eiseniibacteriota bacterium TaxID=2212470 RepID=A0A948W6W4_UNCEI|nr:sigma-54 dependent transcriptional regulator [Candidatus Eisenbacteria bacterium]MBU1949680.1 sigma-54 dependent transcriptional regulator [Candidatus Eisenbacteria bacterium]MBU2691959.1 sigma-54 dependent transcriptional regulator [Candidatus Eisenbacteria bacterium]